MNNHKPNCEIKLDGKDGLYFTQRPVCTCQEVSREEIFVSHGTETHSIKTADKCEDCIKCSVEFEEAKKNGELDRLLLLKFVL